MRHDLTFRLLLYNLLPKSIRLKTAIQAKEVKFMAGSIVRDFENGMAVVAECESK
jgi:hypothetical protein